MTLAAFTKTIDAELRASLATVQLVRFHWDEPADGMVDEVDDYVLDLCLTPRPRDARARFCDDWPATRFEQLGGIFLVPAGHALHARSEGGDQASIICRMRSDAIARWFDGGLDWNDRRLQASLDIASPQVRGLLLRLAQEARHPGLASDTMSELIAAQLTLELARYCGDITDLPSSGGLAPWRLRLIDDRLTEESVPPTLDELATLCGLSVRQLTRGFRASRGLSIGTHIEQVRIGQARRLLGGPGGIKGIAHQLGFASPSGFAYAFRRATGETPREFRQRLSRH
ncbi:MAG: AraC family transcriptional regulator [Sphingobium sp.]